MVMQIELLCVMRKVIIIDGDQIIAALALQWKNKKILKGGVVGTLMSNYGLEKFLKKRKLNS